MSKATVKANPLTAVILMGLAAGFLFVGYEFVRSTANTLFKGVYGKEKLPLVMALVPVGLFVMLYIYGRILSIFGARKALQITSGLSAISIFACFVGYEAGWEASTAFLFMLREGYIIIILEQYWSFMVSTLSDDDAKRFNGLFCGIASLGSIIGAYGVSWLSEPLGTSKMLIFGALAIFPATILADFSFTICGEPFKKSEEKDVAADHLGISLFKSRPLLILLFLLIMATQLVSTVLDLAFQNALQDSFPNNPDRQNAFSGSFFAWLNIAAALGQFLFAPLALKYLPYSWILLSIPFIHVLTGGFLWYSPTLFTAGLAFLVFKAIDYSIFRAAKEILYIPFSFDIRYRAKEIIDVFGYRFGKGGTSLAITLAQSGGIVFPNSFFGIFAIGGSFFWLLMCIPIILSIAEKSSMPAENQPA